MRRLGLLYMGPVPVPVYETTSSEIGKLADLPPSDAPWGVYDLDARTIYVNESQDRGMLLATLCHEIVHAAVCLCSQRHPARRPDGGSDIILEEEATAQAVGNAMAQNWAEINRIAYGKKVRK